MHTKPPLLARSGKHLSTVCSRIRSPGGVAPKMDRSPMQAEPNEPQPRSSAAQGSVAGTGVMASPRYIVRGSRQLPVN